MTEEPVETQSALKEDAQGGHPAVGAAPGNYIELGCCVASSGSGHESLMSGVFCRLRKEEERKRSRADFLDAEEVAAVSSKNGSYWYRPVVQDTEAP